MSVRWRKRAAGVRKISRSPPKSQPTERSGSMSSVQLEWPRHARRSGGPIGARNAALERGPGPPPPPLPLPPDEANASAHCGEASASWRKQCECTTRLHHSQRNLFEQFTKHGVELEQNWGHFRLKRDKIAVIAIQKIGQ